MPSPSEFGFSPGNCTFSELSHAVHMGVFARDGTDMADCPLTTPYLAAPIGVPSSSQTCTRFMLHLDAYLQGSDLTYHHFLPQQGYLCENYVSSVYRLHLHVTYIGKPHDSSLLCTAAICAKQPTHSQPADYKQGCCGLDQAAQSPTCNAFQTRKHIWYFRIIYNHVHWYMCQNNCCNWHSSSSALCIVMLHPLPCTPTCSSCQCPERGLMKMDSTVADQMLSRLASSWLGF